MHGSQSPLFLRTRIFKITLIICVLLFFSGCSKNNAPLQGYLEGEYINLASNFSGILKKLLIARGNKVKAGQLLYVLDNEPEAAELALAQQQLAQAEKILLDLKNGQRETILQAILAQRDQAKADLTLSTENLKRYRTLYQQKVIAKATLDQAESNYQRDLNQVNQFNANLAEAKQGARENAIQAQQAVVAARKSAVDKAAWQLTQKSVYAPVSGRIFDTYYQVGEFVNAQQPVVSLLAPNDIKLVFYIPEPKRYLITIEKSVHFACDGCTHRFRAIVNYISPEAEYTPPVIFSRESRKKLVYRVEAKLLLKEAEQLYPGQPVDVFLSQLP